MTITVLMLASLVTSALSAVVGMGGGIALLALMASLLPPAVVVPLHGIVRLFSDGTRVLERLSPVTFRRVFVTVLVVIAVQLIFW